MAKNRPMRKLRQVVPKNGGTQQKMPDAASSPQLSTVSDGEVRLSEGDQKILREFEQELHRSKMELANLVVRIELMKSQQNQLVQKLLDTDRGFFERIKKTASSYGLNLETEKWNFDAGKMTFSRLS